MKAKRSVRLPLQRSRYVVLFVCALAAAATGPALWPSRVQAMNFTSGPSVRVTANTKVEIFWTADFVGHGKVELLDNPEGVGAPIASNTSSTTANDHTLDFNIGGVVKADTTYYYRITHRDPNGNVPDLINPAPLPSFFTGASTGEVLINFESIAGITALSPYGDGCCTVPTVARLSTQLQMSDGLTFSSTAGYVAVVTLGSGHATSGTKGIAGVNASNVIKYNQPVVITFTMPGSPSIKATTNFVSIRGDQVPAPGSATLQAFDQDGVLIGSVTRADVTGGLTLSLSIPNIHSIRLTQTRSDIGFDDLKFNAVTPAISEPPTASAGADQSIRAGQTASLNGSESSDDNTATEDLTFAWTLTNKPDGSSAVLTGANTIAPQFAADLPGEYIVSLIVTDEDGLMSSPDTVVVSSLNAAPVADAGVDKGAFVGEAVILDGLTSYDPDGDPLEFVWTLVAPDGSAAVLSVATSAVASFTPDISGTYTATLTVSDPFGAAAVDSVVLSAISPGDFAADQITSALNLIAGLDLDQVTTRGNRQALQNYLTQALVALQAGDLDEARSKLMQAIERTDGCVLRGIPDGNGSGRDWVTDCVAQEVIYEKLMAALNVLTP